jgi:autotransporter-associated beta strand protein
MKVIHMSCALQAKLLLCVAMLCCATMPLQAADGVWVNNAGDQLWSTAANWSSNVVATGVGATVDFSTLDLVGDTTVHLDSARTLSALIFGDVNIISSAGWALDNNASAGNVLTLEGAPASIRVNALANGKATTVSAVIAGTDGLAKTGAGTLRCTAVNTFTGGFSVEGGTVIPSSERGLGATPPTPDAANISLSNGATLVIAETGDMIFGANRGIVLAPGQQTIAKGTRKKAYIHGVISGSGGVNWDDTTALNGDGGGGGRLNLYAANTFSGDSVILYRGQKDPGVWLHHTLALQNSTLVYETANTPNSSSPQHNLLWFNSGNDSYTLGGLRGNKNLDLSPQGNTCHRLKIGNNNADTLYSGVISSGSDPDAGIAKIGSGTLSLSGVNTYSGETIVSNGTLRLTASGAIANSPRVTLAEGARLDVSDKAMFIMEASQPFVFELDASGSAGQLVATGLDIGSADVTLNVSPLDSARVFVVAEYTSLTGTQFATLNELPERCRIDYAFQGNKIALLCNQDKSVMFILR